MRRTKTRRVALALAGGLALTAIAIVILAQFEPTRALIVRAYVRADRAWSRDFPVAQAKGLVGSVEPLFVRAGVMRPVRVEVEPGVNLLLDPEDDVARTILISRQGRWEPEVWASIAGGLSAGAVFLDVGAHIGYDSLKASRVVGDTGKVVAFEPNPNTLAMLRANIEASNARNVIVQPIACTDAEQTLTLFDSTPGGNSGSSSLSRENAGQQSRSYQVRARPIDDVVEELGLERVDVLKADIEGAELMALRGAAKTLKRFRPKLILEVVPRQLANMGTSVEELEAYIQQFGYGPPKVVDYKNKEWTKR